MIEITKEEILEALEILKRISGGSPLAGMELAPYYAEGFELKKIEKLKKYLEEVSSGWRKPVIDFGAYLQENS